MEYRNRLIDRYLRNVLNKREKEDFFNLIKEDASFKEEYFLQKDKYDYSYMKNNSTLFDTNMEWNIVDHLISKNNSKTTKSRLKVLELFPIWLKVAAIVIIGFGLGWSGKFLISGLNKDNSKAYVITVPRGQQSKISLTDGTIVWINSHSEIKIPANFSINNRKLSLVGEAYFKVVKNSNSPFLVNTNDLKVKVLGTSFNVRAYSEEKRIITTLEEGKVKLISDKEKRIILPGEQLSYNKVTKSMKKLHVTTKYYTSWKDGKLYMNNMSFEELVYMLEIWYDYKFIYNKKDFINSHFTGVIKREKDLKYILNIIYQVIPITYNINEDKNEILITKLKKNI